MKRLPQGGYGALIFLLGPYCDTQVIGEPIIRHRPHDDSRAQQSLVNRLRVPGKINTHEIGYRGNVFQSHAGKRLG